MASATRGKTPFASPNPYAPASAKWLVQSVRDIGSAVQTAGHRPLPKT